MKFKTMNYPIRDIFATGPGER